MKAIYIVSLFLILVMGLAQAATLTPGIQGECKDISQSCTNCTFVNITSVVYGNGTKVSNLNWGMTKQGIDYNYTFCDTDSLGEYSFNTLGNPDGTTTCDTCSEWVSFEVTPTGKIVDNTGQLSSTIVYFFLILGFGFIVMGFLFLRNESIWVSYTGLFLILLGSTFLYYDLHLTNLYANTIAIDSGANNTTTGVFILVTKMLKLTPYLIVMIILFASVKLLRNSIKKKKSSDGWDDNNY